MKTTTHNDKHPGAARNISAAVMIATVLISPAASSAGPLDILKSKVQQATARVTELKNNVQAKVENVKEKIDELDGEGLEQLMETVGSMLEYLKQAQAGYQQFVGTDRCGPSSPCGVFRGNLRNMIESVIKLPGEMPFVEHVPPAAQRLEQFAKVIDILPPPILFASEKVLGNAFEEINYRLAMLRYAASQAPRFPTMAELSAASARTSTVRTGTAASDRPSNPGRPNPSNAASTSATPVDFPYCAALLDHGKPHVELVTKALEHIGDFLWDLADMMEESKTVVVNAVAGGGTSVKNPAKGTTQLVGFVIKSIRQIAELKIAATASICAAKGYKAP